VLHAGCGKGDLDPVFNAGEWKEIRLDINPADRPDVVTSITEMTAFKNESVNAVYSSHNLEHLYAHEVLPVLKEFCRVLQTGGFVLVSLPDFKAIINEAVNRELDDVLYHSPAGPITVMDCIWGYQADIARGNCYMAHKTGFTAKSLEEKLTAAGFRGVVIQHDYINLMAVAFKRDCR